MKNSIQVKLKREVDDSYRIVFLSESLRRLPSVLRAEYAASSYAIICDKNTERLFGKTLSKNLSSAGLQSRVFSVPPGERSKNMRTKAILEESMLRAGFDRKSMIIALGGGVIGDLAGFVASTYMRGIRYIQLPTTLLAMVDSSIGGKTGINNSLGKNLIGSFWQPDGVYIDLDFLTTLPTPHLKNGLFEAVKIFSALDRESFELMNSNLTGVLDKDPIILKEVIFRAAALKASVVSSDERENSKRMVLNFGHTIGHALEKLSGYKLLHGYAVGMGMLVEAQISRDLGILPQSQLDIIKSVIKDLGILPQALRKFRLNGILDATKGDKKGNRENVKYVLLESVGKVKEIKGEYAHVVNDAAVHKALQNLAK